VKIYNYGKLERVESKDLIMNDNLIAIETFDLTKNFGSLTAVNKLNLKVRRGEIFGFLGPNGAGKTTTIKLMTGLLKPTSGTVKIIGKDIQENPVGAKKDIGLIPE
jgi:ABC-2 type transport system ATP-binding protein